MPAKSRWPGRWDPVFDSMVQHKHSILFVGPANIKYLNRQGELSFKGSLLSQHCTLSLFYSTKHLMLFDYVLCAVFIPVLEDKCLPSGSKQWPMKYLGCCLYAQKQQCEKADTQERIFPTSQPQLFPKEIVKLQAPVPVIWFWLMKHYRSAQTFPSVYRFSQLQPVLA